MAVAQSYSKTNGVNAKQDYIWQNRQRLEAEIAYLNHGMIDVERLNLLKRP